MFGKIKKNTLIHTPYCLEITEQKERKRKNCYAIRTFHNFLFSIVAEVLIEKNRYNRRYIEPEC
jgi:hypothetical protein